MPWHREYRIVFSVRHLGFEDLMALTIIWPLTGVFSQAGGAQHGHNPVQRMPPLPEALPEKVLQPFVLRS